MALRIHEFDNIRDVEFFLCGGIKGGRKLVLHTGGRVLGLHGLTLVFSSPAATVTFADASGEGLTLSDIIDQIVAAVPTLSVSWRDGVINLILSTPTAAVVLDSTGTANTLFGFSASSDHAGHYFNGPSGVTPRFIQAQPKARFDGYYVVVEV